MILYVSHRSPEEDKRCPIDMDETDDIPQYDGPADESETSPSNVC